MHTMQTVIVGMIGVGVIIYATYCGWTNGYLARVGVILVFLSLLPPLFVTLQLTGTLAAALEEMFNAAPWFYPFAHILNEESATVLFCHHILYFIVGIALVSFSKSRGRDSSVE
ncbi:MAG: hypothetical protein GHCLOJNM_00228 [bacterium]|nr:hypothetical protein [bacterium]